MIQKSEDFLNKKNVQLNKQADAFKFCENSDNVKILNSFNFELQLNDSEFVIKNKFKKTLSELRRFTLAKTLVL